MNTEADIQREVAAERARSVQTKASFLVVIAGLLAGASFDTPHGSGCWWLSAIPLALALGTVVAAVVALWPAPAGAADPAAIRSIWIDNTQGSYELEIYLLKVKTVAYSEMQARTNKRVTALKIGFILLSAAISTALVVFILQRWA
ncbi:hypothetical protein [Agromyces subbeticus]|uniref:hypothetical protein n=1 Tax=Agromyces subbeticus TaxID=293890 RepID=UPI0012EC11CD|nr:hypothetical protein [Agromyces subbeticus]